MLTPTPPTLADGTGTAGHYYTVGTAGSTDFGAGSITFTTDDAVYYNGDIWQKLPNLSATSISKSGTGSYYLDLYADEAGTWWCRWEGLGTGQCADEWYFNIRERKVQ